MLNYVTEDLTALHGTSKAGIDVLRALAATGVRLTVVTRSPWPRAALECQSAYPNLNWLQMHRFQPFPQLGKAFPAKIAAFTQYRLTRRWTRGSIRRLSESRMTIVNGLGSRHLWEEVSPFFSGTKYLIMHESIRHCDGPHINMRQAREMMMPFHGYIFVSANCRAEWMSLDFMRGKPATTIANCCDEETVSHLSTLNRADVRQEEGVAPDRFMAVCVGSLQHRKGQDLIVDQMDRLLAEISNIQVYLIGLRDGDWAEALCQRIQRSRFSDSLVVLPPRPSALRLIYAADAVLLPSRAEAMPLVVLEAMALKTPVVASDVDGIPEMIDSGETGWLFSLDRPQGLVEALTEVASDSQRAAKVAEKAHQRYWNEFSRAHQFQRYAQFVGETARQ